MAYAGPSQFRESRTGSFCQALIAGLLTPFAVGVVLIASLTYVSAESDCRTIDDFSKAKVGELPSDWKVRKDTAKDAYRVAEESGLRFLRAVVKGLRSEERRVGKECRAWG